MRKYFATLYEDVDVENVRIDAQVLGAENCEIKYGIGIIIFEATSSTAHKIFCLSDVKNVTEWDEVGK